MTFLRGLLKCCQHLRYERPSPKVEGRKREKVGRKRRKGWLDPALPNKQILIKRTQKDREPFISTHRPAGVPKPVTLQRGSRESATYGDREVRPAAAWNSPRLSPPSLWPCHCPHSFMPGVSASEGQCNPALVVYSFDRTQRYVLGSLVPQGKSQVLCSVFITRGKRPES